MMRDAGCASASQPMRNASRAAVADKFRASLDGDAVEPKTLYG
jgi:hypothetical protein